MPGSIQNIGTWDPAGYSRGAGSSALAAASKAAAPEALNALKTGLLMLAVGLTVIGGSVFAHVLGGQPLGLAVCAILSLLTATLRPDLTPVVLVVGFLFQNLFVSLVSPYIDGADFNSIRGYNFVVAVFVWAVCFSRYVLQLKTFPASMHRLMAISLIAMGVVFVYFVIGLTVDPQSAIVYLRNICLGIMLTQVGFVVGYRQTPNVEPALQIIAYCVLLMGLLEFISPDDWLALINGKAYWLLNTEPARQSDALASDMAMTGNAFVDIKDFFLSDLFNTSLLSDLHIKVYRLNGPNQHSISFSYALSFLMLVMLAHRRYIFIALSFPLLIAVGGKGALIMFVLVTMALLMARLWPNRFLLVAFAALLAGYLAFAITNGLASGDYHVLGFMGGVNGFLRNPIGYGLGSGGNLTAGFAKIDWSAAQNAGSLDVAAESALGVLMYQIGVGAAIVIAVYVVMLVAAWRGYLRTHASVYAMCAFGLLVILVNGVLQEEALFSPLALGVMALYASLKLGGLARREAV